MTPIARSGCRFLRRLVLLASLLLPGCAATRFADLQSDFARLQDVRVQCRTATAPELAPVCGADDSATFAEVARGAQAAARHAPDTRTRIAMLRLGSSAGWESRDPAGLDIAEAAAAEGIALCNELPDDRFGAPRDCALLRVTPGIVVHVRTFLLLESVRDRTALTETERRDLTAAGTGYVRNAWEQVERARREHVDADPATHPSVTSWLDRQRAAFYCTVVQIAAVNRTHGLTPGGSDVLRQADPYVEAQPALASVDCSRMGGP